jgi:hypothetical protein
MRPGFGGAREPATNPHAPARGLPGNWSNQTRLWALLNCGTRYANLVNGGPACTSGPTRTGIPCVGYSKSQARTSHKKEAAR